MISQRESYAGDPGSSAQLLTWVETDAASLAHNIRQLRSIIGPDTLLCACVKANAYGHGLIEASRTFVQAGADWLSVNSVDEARRLRDAGIRCPIYILGYVALCDIRLALALDCRLVVYNRESVVEISRAAGELAVQAVVHLKVETGTNRQGIPAGDLPAFASQCTAAPNVRIEGLCTHFANIEDTTDHSFAELQIKRFNRAAAALAEAGISIPVRHCANSAACILFPETRFEMVRPGIACYGMWPSNETYVSYVRARNNSFSLRPAFTWKTRIAQIKAVPTGDYIGYGCTFRTGRPTRLAVLPVGYYDGYDRAVAGAHVLINGQRACLRGRVCMNILMADVTDIPEAHIEDEVVLIGHSGEEAISAELFARWAGTINYEVTTRVNDQIPRVLVS
jgi:alanine racemase